MRELIEQGMAPVAAQAQVAVESVDMAQVQRVQQPIMRQSQ